MKTFFLTRNGHDKLLLCFAGWGMDAHPFLSWTSAERDQLLVYDYRSLSFDMDLLQSYIEIEVVAWSMGVWAASCWMKAQPDSRVVRSIAFNGTPYPVDDERGIPPAVFQGTLEGLNESNLAKFYRRMCGSREQLTAFLAAAPQRSIESLREELAFIGTASATTSCQTAAWTAAIIGSDDRIFPPAQQQTAWSSLGVRTLELAVPHYDADTLHRLLISSFDIPSA